MTEKTKYGEKFKIKGTLQYFRAYQKDDYDKYGGVLANLSDRAVEELEKRGFEDRVKVDEDRLDWGRYIRISNRFEIETVYDGDEYKDPIGNGTKATITFRPRNWTYQKKSGTALDALKVEITDLIPYEDNEPKEAY